MWKIGLAILLLETCSYPQGPQSFLLPEPIRVDGVVVDLDGTAVANARVYTNDRYSNYETGPDGGFGLNIRTS